MLGLVPVFAMAQTEDTEAISPNPVDTVAWNIKDSIRMALASVPSYSMWLDSRNSFISADPVNVFGLRYGLSWGKISAYTGYYFTSYNQGIAGDSIQYKFNYISSTYEYRLYKTHRFSLTGFAQLGGGIRTVNHLTNETSPISNSFSCPSNLGPMAQCDFFATLAWAVVWVHALPCFPVDGIFQDRFTTWVLPRFHGPFTRMFEGKRTVTA